MEKLTDRKLAAYNSGFAIVRRYRRFKDFIYFED